MAISKKEMDIRRERMLEKAFDLFVHNTIETVTMQNVADAAGVGVASVYRYFPNKAELAIAVAARKWYEVFGTLKTERPVNELENIDAIDRLIYTYNRCLWLYKTNKELFVFTDNFNSFIVHEEADPKKYEEYLDTVSLLDERFHWMYERAKLDKTMRTDYAEEELMRILIHPMLATCSHYAKGIVWGSVNNQAYDKELNAVKDCLVAYARNAG